MSNVHERLQTPKGWTVTSIDVEGDMDTVLLIGARFRIISFGAKTWLEVLEGFHPTMKRFIPLTMAKRSQFPGLFPPHPDEMSAEDDMYACVTKGPNGRKRKLWVMLTWQSSGDVVTIGTPSPMKNHGGAHGVDD